MNFQVLSLLMLFILIGCQASGGGGGDVVSGHVPQVPKFTLTTTLNKTYTTAEDIDFVLTFPANVTVTGTPELDLTIGSTPRVAVYQSGDGTSSLTFRYTVVGGDDDLNGIAVGANINLNGGTLTYTKSDSTVDNCRLDLTLPSLANVKVDTIAPTLTSVTGPLPGNYYLGQSLVFTANFSEAVLISGTPRIAVDIGGTTRYATYLSGTNSSAIMFRYTVANTDTDNDGVTVSSPLDLNGGSIKDGAAQNSTLTFAPPSTTTVLVAGANPIVTSITPPTNGTYSASQNLDFTLTFNKVVNVSGSPRLALTVGSSTKYANYLSGSGTTAIKFRYTVAGGDVDNDGISLASLIDLNSGTIQDSSSNNAVLILVAPNLSAVKIATSAPTILSISIPSSPPATGYDVGQNVDFTVNFSEVMAEAGNTSRLKLDVGGVTRYAVYQSGSGSSSFVYRYAVQANDEDLNGIAIISPLELNGSTIVNSGSVPVILTFTPPVTTSIKVDAKAPVLLSNTKPANGTYISGQNLDFDVTFSEAVIVSGTPRIVIDVGGSTKYANYLSGSATSVLKFRYAVAATDNDADGISVTTNIDLNSGTIADGNLHAAGLALVSTVTTGVLIDTAAPTILSVTPPANGSYSTTQNLDFTVNWSENVSVTGTPRLALTIGSTTRYANYVSGSGSAAHLYRYTLVSGDNDADGIDVNSPVDTNGGTLKDAATNNAVLTFTAPNTTGVLVAGTTPTISSVTPPSNSTYKTSQNVDFTVNFSEAVVVTGTPRIQVTLGSGTVYANYLSGSNSTALIFRYTVAASDADTDGVALVSPLQLNAGTIKNVPGTVSATLTYTAPNTTGVLVDGIDPVISSITPPANKTYILNENLNFIVNYTDNVTVTGTPSLTLTIGSTTVAANYVSGSGTNALTFRYTAANGDLDADGVALGSPVALNAGTIKDAFGDNASLTFTAPNTSGVLVDAVVPTIVSVAGPTPGSYYVNNNLDFDVTLSKTIVVTGTPRISLTVGSSTLYANYISGTGSSLLRFRYTVGVGDFDNNGIATNSPIDLNSGTLKDTAGNDVSPLTFTAPNTALVNVDGNGTSIISVTPPANATYKTSNNLNFSVLFTQPVTVTGTPRIAITAGAATVYADYLSGSGTATLVFRYTVAANDSDADGIALTSPISLNGGTVKDGATQNAGLTFTPPTTTGVLVDGIDPVISSIAPPANKTYILNENLDFIVSYSNNVIVTGTPSLSLTIGSTTVAANYISGSGSNALTFRYTAASGNLDSDGVTLSSPVVLNAGTIKDAFGDNASLTFTAPNTSGVLVDSVIPTIVSVAGPTPGSYYINNNLDFDVTLSKAISVTGSPRIALTIGSSTVYANYLSGSATTILRFRYTVAGGDFDNDGIAVNSPLDLNAGTLKDAAGNDVSPLTFTAPNTALVNVDGNGASIISVTPPANSTYKTANNLNFSVLFTQPVTVTGTPRIGITAGSSSVFANYVSGSGTSTLTFRYTVAANDSDTDGIVLASPVGLNGGSIKDASTQNAVLTFTPPTTTGVLVDGIDLVISSVTPPANKTYLLGENLDFIVNLNGNANVTGSPRIVTTIGSTTRYATYLSGSGTNALTFRYTVAATDVDTDGVTNSSNIDLNSGTVKDAFGDNADVSFLGVNYPNVKVDGVVPTISGVTGPSAGTYLDGQNLDFTVTFSEAVTITGSPRIQLTIGSTTQYATYTSGSGTTTAIFRYTVQPGDTDNNGIASASPLDLNSGTMKDASGNDVTPLTFTVPNTSAVNVDANAALITSVTPPSNATYKTGQNIDFVVNYSRAVNVTGSPRIAISAGVATVYATYLSGTGTTTLTFRYTVGAGDSDSDGIVLSSPMQLNGGTIKDSGLANASLTFTPPTTTGILADGIDIVISSITYPADATYKIAQNMDFTVNFNYPATVTGSPRIQLTVGATTLYATYTSGSGTTAHIYRYTVGVGDLDTDGISVISNIGLNGGTVKDAFGDNATLTFTGTTYANKKVDGVRPTITSASPVTAKTYILNDNMDFTLNFNEAVTITGSPRIWLIVGATTRYATYQSGSGTSAVVFRYTVPTGDLDSNGVAVGNSNTLDINSGSITDAAGNAQTAFGFTPPTLTSALVDAVAPAITGITSPSTTHGLAANINFTVTYDEAVTVVGTPTLSLNVGGGTRTASYVSGSGSTSLVFRYTTVLNDSDTDGVATVSPLALAGGTMKDTAGNNAGLTFTGTTLSGVLVDAVPPSVSSITLPSNASYKPGANLDFTVVWTENVTVTGTPSIALTIGSNTRQANYVSGSGTTSTVFRYTVVSGDNDYDGISANTTLQLNSGTVRDALANNADTSLGSMNLSKVFTIPTELTYWYDLSDTTTVGSSSTTLTQFKSKTSSTADGVITGGPSYGSTAFNNLTGAFTTSSTNYVTMPSLTGKYVVIVYKTPSASGYRLIADTAGSGGATGRLQMILNTSGASGLGLGTNCASSCKRYSGSGTWTTVNGSGNLSYTWATNQYRVLIVDYMGATSLTFQLGANGFDGQIAEYMVFTGSTAVANSVMDGIYTYLNAKHGASY